MNEQITTEQTAETLDVKSDELSTNFFWTSQIGYNLQTTVRGNPSVAEILGHLSAVRDMVHSIVTLGGQAKQVGRQPDKSVPAPQPTAPTTTPPSVPNPSAPAPVSSGDKQIQSMLAIRMEVVPQADGRTRLMFYGAGRKFPDLKTTLAPTDAALLMAPTGDWEVQHFAAAQTYQLQSTYIDYVFSDKTNSAGNPWRDIIAARRG